MWRLPLLVAATGVFALTAACGTATNTGSAPSSTTPSSTSVITLPTGSGAPLSISDATATRLCDLIKPQLSDWRVQGPTLGKIALNATVHQWALENGAINLQVLADKDVVDRVTTKSCADVHDQAVKALEIPNLAAGLVG